MPEIRIRTAGRRGRKSYAKDAKEDKKENQKGLQDLAWFVF
jgi:hypothetical protein